MAKDDMIKYANASNIRFGHIWKETKEIEDGKNQTETDEWSSQSFYVCLTACVCVCVYI